MTSKVIIIFGPTASGKTAVAIDLAQKVNGIVINADSKQIYKGLPIITAQPTIEEMQNIEHLMYGYVDCRINYNADMYLKDAIKNINYVIAQNKTPILVGGTGMYLQILLNGLSKIPDIPEEVVDNSIKLLDKIGKIEFKKRLYALDPIAADKIADNNIPRLLRAYNVVFYTGKSIYEWHQMKEGAFLDKFDVDKFFLNVDRELLYQKCNKRFRLMVNSGALEEVRKLQKMNLNPILPIMKGHGIPELIKYLNGEISLEIAIEIAQKNTRHYIKRQITWFKHQFQDFNALSAKDILSKY